jgi:thiol-disulfide isomerase/thioredoxin
MKVPTLLFAIVVSVWFAAPLAAETGVALLKPDHPVADGPMTITYDTGAPGARLDAADDLYAAISYWSTDHAYHRQAAIMRRGPGTVFSLVITVPGDAAVLTVSFATLHAYDDRTSVQTLIYRPDHVPVRTAWEQSILSGQLPHDYLDRVEREMALYPDNFAAYRNKWFVAEVYNRSTLGPTLVQDMRRLRRRIHGEPLEGLYALSCGHVRLGHADEARAILKRMFALYPGAPLTAAGISDYLYHAYSQHWDTAGREELGALSRRIIVAYPDSQVAREDMAAYARYPELPLSALEATADGWMKEAPDDPLPAFHLANTYESRGVNLERAALLAARAVDGMLRGLLRPYEDSSGSLTQIYLPDACLTAARIELKLDHPGLALGYAKISEAVGKETAPDPWILEGNAWDALRDSDAAEAAYFEAYHRGSKEAEPALRRTYVKRHGSVDGFEDHLTELAGRSAVAPSSAKPAPGFKVATAEGAEFELASLKGKVLVLNFWATGCGPCVAEIPNLNQLVEKFRTRDVIFLALAGDPNEWLAPFLAEHPFAYQVIPSAGAVFTSYEVASLPVHVVIGRQGEIVARLTGAGEDRADQLSLIIEQALAR